MTIANTKKRSFAPTHPGVMLREDFMPDYGLTVSSLATALKVSRQSVNELLNGRRALTPLMALRLSRLFGNSSRFWMNAQMALDLWRTEQENLHDLNEMSLLKVA
jgi:antitoxin HigA-1